MNMELLTAVRKVAERRANEKLSRNDALRLLVKEGINNRQGGLTKAYGGKALKKQAAPRRK
jgi:hypothetical protein